MRARAREPVRVRRRDGEDGGAGEVSHAFPGLGDVGEGEGEPGVEQPDRLGRDAPQLAVEVEVEDRDALGDQAGHLGEPRRGLDDAVPGSPVRTSDEQRCRGDREDELVDLLGPTVPGAHPGVRLRIEPDVLEADLGHAAVRARDARELVTERTISTPLRSSAAVRGPITCCEGRAARQPERRRVLGEGVREEVR